MTAFEAQGVWWLPGHEDCQVPGTLAWHPARGGTLRLVGQLWPIVLLDNELSDGSVQKYRDRTHDADKRYPVVLGEVEKTSYTLLNGFQTMRREWSLDQSTETLHVNSILEGAWLGPDLEVDTSAFRMRDLAEWIDISGLTDDAIHPGGVGQPFATVWATSLPDEVISATDPKIAFGQSLKVTHNGNRWLGLEQDWLLRVSRNTAVPAQELIDVGSAMQDLVSIATGRTAEFQRVTLFHPRLPLLTMGGTRIGKARKELIYHAQWSNRVDHEVEGVESSEPMSPYEMYFSYQHIGPEGVNRWFETAVKFRTELGRAMASRYHRGYLEDAIMNVCAALESFDKHRRETGKGRIKYVVRIEECIKLAGPEFADLIVDAPAAWAEKVRGLRNDLAHHRDRFRLEGSVGGHLISEQLFWLFVICMLRVARAPDQVFTSIAKHPQWVWLRMKAQESVIP